MNLFVCFFPKSMREVLIIVIPNPGKDIPKFKSYTCISLLNKEVKFYKKLWLLAYLLLLPLL